MAVYPIRLKLVLTLSAKTSVTEPQIRGYLTDFAPQASAWIEGIVASAPPAAEASIDSLTWQLKIDNIASGLWLIYPKPALLVTVADTVTAQQAHAFLRGFYDDAKTKLRNLVAAVSPSANLEILEWHVHRLTVDGVEESYDEVEP